MNATARYSLARGVRLRAGDCGEAMLLVPEGIVRLNETAVATLELVDGIRGADEIAQILAERYEANGADMTRDVGTLLEAFAARGFVREA